MIAGMAHDTKPKLFPLLSGPRYEVAHEGQLLTTLQAHFQDVLLSYVNIQQQDIWAGATVAPVPQLSVVAPSDMSEKMSDELQLLSAWLFEQTNIVQFCGILDFYKIFRTGYFSVQPSNAQLVLVDSILEPSTVYFANESLSRLNFIEKIETLSYDAGILELHKHLVTSLSQESVIFDESLQNQLFSKLLEFDPTQNELILEKKQHNFNAKYTYFLSKYKYYNYLNFGRGHLRNTLKDSKLDLSKETVYLFCGDFFKNEIFDDFCQNVLCIEKKHIKIFNNLKIFTYLCKGLGIIYKSSQQTKIETTFLSRQTIVERIQNECTEKKKFKKYAEKFVPLGLIIGMPESYTLAILRSQLYGSQGLIKVGRIVNSTRVSFQPSIHEQVFSSNVVEKIQQKEAIVPQETHFINDDSEPKQAIFIELQDDNLVENSLEKATKTYHFGNEDEATTIAKTLEEADLLRSNLSWFFRVEKYYQLKSCVCFKGKTKDNEEERVFYFLPTESTLNDKKKFDEFLDRNHLYYGNDISEVFQTAIGTYYSRPFYDGLPLNKYIQKIELNKKVFFNELSSSELELLLEIWRQVNDLPFTINNVTAKHFLVRSTRTITLKKKVNVILINLDLGEENTHDMYENVHELLRSLLSKPLYNFFETNFKQ